YTVTGNLQMPHMPATGVSGVDLYAKAEKNHWLWAAGKFSFGDTIVYRFSHLSAINREYVLYLPLYNTVKWMQISVPKENRFTPLPTRKEKPVVVYGTSIAQGACASRPGLAWTNILGRLLNVPVINLGFSGNGRLEPELIELLTQIDASVYVLDCLPNLTSGYISNSELKQRIVNAIKQLRSKKPFTPILLTEHDGYSDGEINSVRYNEYTAVNKTLDEMVDSLTRKGFQQIYLLKKDAINQDIETMVDGTHPNDMGMMRYADAYEKKLKGILKKESHVLSQPPSLIPLPQQLKWDEGFFDLSKCAAIVVKHPLLKKEALYIQNELKKKGFSITVTEKRPLNRLAFEMIINAEDTLSSEEGYHLKVDAQKIQLTAKKAHGIFNGLQTFLQLISKGGQVKACEITDWPQFGWRGYMVDVGRNYQSMALLKQQIDIMSHYKLNIFHLHLTEDIAWRLEVPGYPALTAPQNMERNKGMYYSVAELKELIRYCNDRYITLVPEIDMPGHSAAFQRALGVPMQSAEGLQIIKKILTSICTTYDVPYLHLGGDEVTITYAPFLPAVTQL
ncbi:MAG TPA: SGNH/GDSL hydrolase family protein, partial [Flavisolibacter sp.]|nr:SGNH/GDSL hydrolase family protein [Flavisolibacter sp.]